MSKLHMIAEGLGIESITDETVIGGATVITDVTGDEPAPGEIEAAQLEVAEAANAVEKTEEVLDDLTTTAAALEAFREVIVDSMKMGGLYPQTAAVIETSIKTHLSMIGLKVEKAVLPSVECFGGTADRKDSTVVSLEAIDGWGKKIVDAIKAIIAKVKEAFKNFFDAEDKKLAILDKWAGAIATKSKDQTQREGNFVAGPELTYQDKSDVASLIAGFNAAIKAFNPGNATDRTIGDVIESTLSKIVKILGSVSASVEKLDNQEEAAKVKELLEGFKESLGKYEIPGFIGVNGITLDFNGFTIDRAKDGKNDLPLLSAKDTKALADVVAKTVKTVREMRKLFQKGIEQWEGTISGLQKQLEKVSDKSSAPANLMSIVSWNKSFVMGRTIMYSITQSCFAALKYCAASQGKGEAKA